MSEPTWVNMADICPTATQNADRIFSVAEWNGKLLLAEECDRNFGATLDRQAVSDLIAWLTSARDRMAVVSDIGSDPDCPWCYGTGIVLIDQGDGYAEEYNCNCEPENAETPRPAEAERGAGPGGRLDDHG